MPVPMTGIKSTSIVFKDDAAEVDPLPYYLTTFLPSYLNTFLPSYHTTLPSYFPTYIPPPRE